jgi:hypothetical protein
MPLDPLDAPELHGHIGAILERLTRMQQGQLALETALTAALPRYMSAHAFDPAGGNLIVRPMTHALERIDTVLVFLPTGSSAILQLRDLVIPVGAGITQLLDLGLLMHYRDPRTLTVSNSGGPGSLLYVAGQVMPLPHSSAR